ncbi:MAG: helix-turn-helix domain-containing protein [Verrucomicrobiota bacterium]
MPHYPNTVFYLPHEGAPCPISWQAVGEDCVSTPKYNWPGSNRNANLSLIWQATMDGCGRIDIGNRKGIELGPGSSFLAYFPSDHCYYFSPQDQYWKFRYIIWRGPAIENYFRAACQEEVYVIRARQTGKLLNKLGAILEMYEDGDPDPWQNVSDAIGILNPLLQLAQRIDHVGEEQADSEAADIAVPIEKDPSLPVEKQGWAEAKGLSRYQLYRRVKAQTGMSPKDLRNRQRLREAIKFLKKANVSVSDAATLSGFSSQNYFARFFKKHTGYSPSEWRKLFARAEND